MAKGKPGKQGDVRLRHDSGFLIYTEYHHTQEGVHKAWLKWNENRSIIRIETL